MLRTKKLHANFFEKSFAWVQISFCAQKSETVFWNWFCELLVQNLWQKRKFYFEKNFETHLETPSKSASHNISIYENCMISFLPNKLIFDDTLTFMPIQVSLEKKIDYTILVKMYENWMFSIFYRLRMISFFGLWSQLGLIQNTTFFKLDQKKLDDAV